MRAERVRHDAPAARAAAPDVDWEALVEGLPEKIRVRLGEVLRRYVRRRLDRAEVTERGRGPQAVREEAVCLWRARYLDGASKRERKRHGYEHIRGLDTYMAIEHEVRARQRRARALLAQMTPEGVERLGLPEVCAAFADLWQGYGATPLDDFVADVLEAEVPDVEGTLLRIRRRVLATCRTQNMAKVARVPKIDAFAHSSGGSEPFSLVGACTTDDVVARVRASGLVRCVLKGAFGTPSVHDVIVRLVLKRMRKRASVKRLRALVIALTGDERLVSATLRHVAARRADAGSLLLTVEGLEEEVVGALLENPVHGPEYERSVTLMHSVRSHVSETPWEAYPLARSMRRRIIVHAGPTNSGKTHDALRSLMAAESGAYLGPLRLLAAEQYLLLNREGVPCSLLTGEEHTEVAGARHVSSTVEMADVTSPVACAVIDEAQMLADPERGHHWTAAILGMPAAVLHVCCAPHATDIVCRLARFCTDDVTVIEHKRLVPLEVERGAVAVPRDVRAGDALVVFSRRSVHAVAGQVRASGLSASVVYGALPHDVRLEEARRFAEGETDVVVATDAIGMGMNLPIRRVVFVETKKFDGREVRPLTSSEVRQIAGRAGRFGRYERGSYCAVSHSRAIERSYLTEPKRIRELRVGIPPDIVLVATSTLSEAVRQWTRVPETEPFRRLDVTRELALIDYAESLLDEGRLRDQDAKRQVLALATMPFDERDGRLVRTWRKMAAWVLTEERSELQVPGEPRENASLAALEADFRLCDLLYAFGRTFGCDVDLAALDERRLQISHAIMGILARA